MTAATPRDGGGGETAGAIGERELIRRLAARLGPPPAVPVGIGDDTAVVPGGEGEEWLLTSDALLEGVHFRPGTEPEWIGHKAVARNLSDLAAMGGTPRYGLINLVAPRHLPVAFLERIYDGAARVAARYGLALVGGDTSGGDSLALHVFLTGSVPAGTACLRSGARPGDRLMVTGDLGGSGAGRHLRFEPRVGEGIWIRSGGWATAMIDLSDGLATDLGHLASASGVGARLDAGRIPIAAAAGRSAGAGEPLHHALTDGEDFELLFSVPGRRAAAFRAAWDQTQDTPVTDIGEVIEAAGGVVLKFGDGRTEPIPAGGYEHFRV